MPISFPPLLDCLTAFGQFVRAEYVSNKKQYQLERCSGGLWWGRGEEGAKEVKLQGDDHDDDDDHRVED